jgi:hypothetical protein
VEEPINFGITVCMRMFICQQKDLKTIKQVNGLMGEGRLAELIAVGQHGLNLYL